MVRLAKKIGTITSYKEEVYIFELRDGKKISYVMGGYYNKWAPISLYAFFKSDKYGTVEDDKLVIQGEGVNTFREIFQLEGYTLIDGE